jgi:2-aminoadipate transaminase
MAMAVNQVSDRSFARRMAMGSADGLTSILAMATATDLISFAGGFPDPVTFAGQELAEIMQRLISSGDTSALQYAPVAGLPGPRAFLTDRLEAREGYRPPPDELMITSGTIEALELISKSVLDPGDVVFVEAPTYLGAIMAFESFEADVVGVPMDRDGLDVDALERAIQQHGSPKFLYSIPDHQNPAGVSLAAARRPALVDLARKHGFFVVEDVAYRELGFTDERPPSLLGLGPDVVLQAGTFSKTFFPGVRLGWAAGPADIVAHMVRAKQNTDQCAGALGQRLLEEYGRAGGLEAQATRARDLYGRRCRLMLEALAAQMPSEVRWTEPLGGFFTWLTLPERMDAVDLARKAVEQGVAIVPGAPFFPDGSGTNNVRLSFSRVDDQLIPDGIERLAALVKQQL